MFVKPVITWEVAAVLNVRGAWATPFKYGVTTYPVIAVPPLLAGATQLTVADKRPGRAVAAVGDLGTVAGTATFDVRFRRSGGHLA